jgi:DNA polymerase-3 subunit epsilon
VKKLKSTNQFITEHNEKAFFNGHYTEEIDSNGYINLKLQKADGRKKEITSFSFARRKKCIV